jgi:tRNA-specific 2-thiouridylase
LWTTWCDAYAHGLTPNPDVMCNQTVKFGTFAERAFARGADLIATGHYARVRRTPQRAPPQLLRAVDEHKDQTYFLWRVGEEAFSRTLFPVGDVCDKAEVRRMCAERGLGVESKPDSDGICFVGPVGISTFLLDTLERRAGDIVEWETGRVLGHHDGAFLFTVGQRKGLDLGGGPARYVVSTDTEKNVVYVTADPACPGLWCTQLDLSDVRWIAGEPPADGEYLVRTRHTGELRACPRGGARRRTRPRELPRTRAHGGAGAVRRHLWGSRLPGRWNRGTKPGGLYWVS